MSADESVYRIINKLSGERTRVFTRRQLAAWLGKSWNRYDLNRYYRIERATQSVWHDVTEEFE